MVELLTAACAASVSRMRAAVGVDCRVDDDGMPSPLPHQHPDRTTTLAALAAHILRELAEAGKPTSVHQLRARWERERPDDGPGTVARDIHRALTRLHEARVIVWRGSNRIQVRNDLTLRLAAEQYRRSTRQ